MRLVNGALVFDKEELEQTLIIIGNKIREWRKFENKTQVNVALLAGIDRAHLAKIESGKSNPSIITITKIAASLDLTFTEMLIEKPLK